MFSLNNILVCKINTPRQVGGYQDLSVFRKLLAITVYSRQNQPVLIALQAH